jgi:hypothetical protein
MSLRSEVGMSYSISQLRDLWRRESESYKTQEIGSGVQRFVKAVLECSRIFDLVEGNLTTPPEKRQNEFIHEKKTKQRRQADFVVYIDSDIVIPVEVEQLGKIWQGEEQLVEYQSDLEKKYGILTDGYTWRFYNNNIFRSFTIDELLSKPEYFLEYWKEYIKPQYYYLSYFEETGQLQLIQEDSKPIENYRQLFFRDITTLISSFRHKLQIEGFFEGLSRKEAEKKSTEIAYAYIIQFILYKTLVDNAFDDFAKDYEGRIKSIHKALQNLSYKEILVTIEGISHAISRNIYRPFNQEQEQIHSKILELYDQVKNELADVSPWLDILMFIKKYDFRSVRNEIFGYVYENYLKEIYEDEKRGQYYTDPAVVKFMLGQVGYKADKLKGKVKSGDLTKMSIVDPACGSGTFLYSSTSEIMNCFNTVTVRMSERIKEIVTSNVFGLDVAEFPLYLAEMSILMRMLPLLMKAKDKYNDPLEKKIKVFLTEDSIAEFVGSNLITLGKQTTFPDKVIRPKFTSFMRTEEDLSEMKGSMTAFPRRRFDYVIANPPYISYNECARQGLLIFKLIKGKVVKLNDIYGVNLHSIPSAPKKYAPKPNLYAFFIALGLALLKDGGQLCYIVPQTMLSTGDLDVIRYHLARYWKIERIITFNHNLFVSRGLSQNKVVPTSSLIFVVNKNEPSRTHEVEIINYTGKASDSIEDTLCNITIEKNTDRKFIPQSQLLESVTNWNFIKQSEAFGRFDAIYIKNSLPMSIYYEHETAERTFGMRFYLDGGGTIDKRLLTTSATDSYEVFHYKDNDYQNCLISRSDEFYPLDGKVTFPQGSQGIATFQQRYKIVWRTKALKQFQFTESPILLINNQSLVLASNCKQEILYLLALLNSPVIRFVLEKNLRQENEKDFLVSIKAIKKYVRVPKVTIATSIALKTEIITRTQEMLDLEKKTLADFVDFSEVLVQKFDDVTVSNNALILSYNSRTQDLKISGDSELVAAILIREFGAERSMLEQRSINLQALRNLQVIDRDRQKLLKGYIDDLVFSLYFGIKLQDYALEKASQIKAQCHKSDLYRLIES